MADRAVATKLVFKELGLPESIASLDDRKALQKAIYLAQAAGVPLGYGFSWYLRGPYSSTLAKDYYNMPVVDLSSTNAPKLKSEFVDRLQKVRAIIGDERRPQGVKVPEWLELIASVHYLSSVSKLDQGALAAKMEQEKPALAPHIHLAKQVLGERLN